MSVVNCFEHQPGLFCHACIFFLNRFLKVAFAVMLCQLLDTMLWFIVDIYNDIWSLMVRCLSGNHLTFLYVYIDCVWFDVTLKRDMWNIFRRPVFIGARRKPLPSLEKLTIGVNKDRSRIHPHERALNSQPKYVLPSAHDYWRKTTQTTWTQRPLDNYI